MTREEAVAKLKDVRCADATYKQTISANYFVDGLVTLGLLNLEEPKPGWHADVVKAVRQYTGTSHVAPIDVINALQFAGLKVVRC